MLWQFNKNNWTVKIQEAYLQLALADIQAALAYAAEVMRQEILLP